MSSASTFLYNCDFCRVSLGTSLHIECATCRDIHLCLECFAYGKEVPPHKNDHDYYVMEYIGTSLFAHCASHWSGMEEILLIHAIEKYGIGNWDEISEHIGNPSKDSRECERHYYSIYICKPDIDTDATTLTMTDDSIPSHDVDSYESKMLDSDSGIVAPPYLQFGNDSKTMDCENVNKMSGFIGFSPWRNEFDSEKFDEAEVMVSEIHFSPNDEREDRLCKLRLLEAYNKVLKMRDYRRNFIINRNLLRMHSRPHKCKDENETQIRKLFDQCASVAGYFDTTEHYSQFITNTVFELKEIKKKYHKFARLRRDYGCRSYKQTQQCIQDEKLFSGVSISNDTQTADAMDTSTTTTTATATTDAATAASKSAVISEKIKMNKNMVLQSGELMLSMAERSLCKHLSMTPTQYMAIKEAIQMESMTRGGCLSRRHCYHLFDSFKTHIIDDLLSFFQRCGWLQLID